MAMQAGMGLSKVVILLGAGTIMLSNESIATILENLRGRLKNQDNTDLAALMQELERSIRGRQPLPQQSIIIRDNSSGNVTSLAMPVAVLGALGYGYMWWKGLSLSDLMYVTKSSMANAVSSMTKHLEQVTSALAATKKHLTQRLENLDGKLDDQREMSKLIKDEVTEVRTDISQLGFDLDSLRGMLTGLDGKICSLEDKQDYANYGVCYLINFVGGAKDPQMGEYMKALPKPRKPNAFLLESPSSMGLKELTEGLMLGTTENFSTEAITPSDVDNSRPRSSSRILSAKC